MIKNCYYYMDEIGRRIKIYRVSSGMTQEELGEKSGVSVRSISRLEQGSSVQMDNLIRILIALGLDSNIELLIPDQASRPSYYLRKNGNYRVRARKDDKKQEFKWGDEQ